MFANKTAFLQHRQCSMEVYTSTGSEPEVPNVCMSYRLVDYIKHSPDLLNYPEWANSENENEFTKKKETQHFSYSKKKSSLAVVSEL